MSSRLFAARGALPLPSPLDRAAPYICPKGHVHPRGRGGRRRGRASALGATLLAAALGCTFNDPLPEDLGACPDDSAAPEPTPGLTYYRDIQPLLAARCGECHRDGGIAPFAFDTYASAYPARDLLAQVVAARTMPPWPPGRCCEEYLHDRALTDDEVAAIVGWAEEGAPEGAPADSPAPEDLPPGEVGLSRVDLELTMPAAYTPSDPDGDEVRCFVLDWPEDQQRFITGLDVRPGDPDTVHHAIVYAVPPAKAAVYEALADADEAPGWSCPGGLAEGGDTVVGGWVPGSRGYDFPNRIGRGVAPGAKIILSVHYRFPPATPSSDQTAIALRLDDAVDREIQGLAVYNPAWLVGKAMKIPAGDDDVRFTYGYDPAVYTGGAALIHNVSLHMHERGASGSLAVERADGSVDCLLNIDDWDYDWQGDYWLADPVELRTGDRLKVECHFDNSASNQRPGEEPKELWWGDDLEMCIATVLVTAP
ncbi:MAG: monooxygenase [Myxococcales bacterium]|nr:monooxygenase [Myxococcales bacterium]